MTVQTQTHPGIGTRPGTKVRRVKGFVIGFVALAAAATGIGIAVSGSDAPSTVIAPVIQTNPSSGQREALKRLEEQGPGAGSAAESEVVRYPSGKPQMK